MVGLLSLSLPLALHPLQLQLPLLSDRTVHMLAVALVLQAWHRDQHQQLHQVSAVYRPRLHIHLP